MMNRVLSAVARTLRAPFLQIERIGFFAVLAVCIVAMNPQAGAQRTRTRVQVTDPFLLSQAHWIDRGTILIPQARTQEAATYWLTTDPTGKLARTETEVTGGSSVELSAGGDLSSEERERFPQLGAGYAVLTLPATVNLAAMHEMLRGQLVVSVRTSDGRLAYATGVQSAGVLDDLFAYTGPLGAQVHGGSGARSSRKGDVSVAVWAPTAQTMQLLLFDSPDQASPTETRPLQEKNGVWSTTLASRWVGHYYLFDEKVYAPSVHAVVQHRVTDPYSTDLSLNGTMSRIMDPDEPENAPAGWAESASPALAHISDLSIYELHVRDFSIADATVPVEHRGTYAAFSDTQADGMTHLRALELAGLKAVHLLPTFHMSGINEDKTQWKTTGDLSKFGPASEEQQKEVAAISKQDGYGWSYNPVHYMAPAGAYAIHPDQRVREYRGMVMALHRAGLRVIQDVVFNHVSASGEAPDSVLDKIVPGYYLRLDENGNVFTSTCCSNTASEHSMMGRLQLDTILWNARHYKVDGFRFDLMSFTFVKNLQQMKAALNQLTIAKDGVDGSKIYLYGEGWEFGEIAHNAYGVSAIQANLHGTGVGSFNDRLRDSVRGGSPSGEPRVQGFATGMFTDASSFTKETMPAPDQRRALLQQEDLIRLGMAGNLQQYTLTNADGAVVAGREITHGGKAAGYTASPIETVNYVSVHDDRDLFDQVQIKSAEGDSATVRARRQVVAMSVVALGQGIPFFMAADDLLRSKDMDSDSYDSGDWFNRIDWTGNGNNWGTGLPVRNKNEKQWPIERPLLENAALTSSRENIQSTAAAFRELLRIRYSSPLFRLETAEDVTKHLRFLNTGPQQTPGLIVMELSTESSKKPYRHVVVVINADIKEQRYTAEQLRGLPLHLHPVQMQSADATVRRSAFESGTGQLSVPALTTAVFVSR